MKYIYIAGLGHSGSTLLNHLLTYYPNTIVLGEVTSFFSPSHMHTYMKKWGEYPDVSFCSCGKKWQNCDFWGKRINLSGLKSNSSLLEKYQVLIESVKENCQNEEVIIIDSSKSLSTLQSIIGNHVQLGLAREKIYVIFNIKDVRSFTASMLAKKDTQTTLIPVLRWFNYWLGANQQFLSWLENNNIQFFTNVYETLCNDPEMIISNLFKFIHYEVETKPVSVMLDHNRSHIAMGNKNFVLRNRDRLKYDSKWYVNDTINLAHTLHYRARKFNNNIYQL
jgi:LPS sulfotransferase NodH